METGREEPSRQQWQKVAEWSRNSRDQCGQSTASVGAPGRGNEVRKSNSPGLTCAGHLFHNFT